MIRTWFILVVAWLVVRPAHAQTHPGDELFPTAFVPAWVGADAEYDALADPPDAPPAVPPVTRARPEGPLPFDLERADDPELLAFLDYYEGEGRRRMTNWLARSGRYRSIIEPMLAEAGVPTELFWVIAVESAFDPDAESPVGAVGLWQFMSRTARSRGLRVDRRIDERRDPIAATRAAIDHFRSLHERFGSWMLALAAYNAGHGHVRGELREANATDFWELDAYGAVYTNARRYALRVATIAIIDRNREAYGYAEVVDDPVWSFDVVEVPGNVRLSLFGEAVDLDANEMLALNPSLVGMRTPPDAETWPLRIPAGTHAAFVASYDRLRSRYGEDHEVVTLRFGETVEDVADRWGIPARVLRSINGLPYGAASPYGSEILVPTRRRSERSSEPSGPTQVVVAPTRFAFADQVRVFYDTRPGDTLVAIAGHFGVDPYHLAAWNDVDVDGELVSGLTLQVFVAPDFDLTTTVHRTEAEVLAIPLGSPEYDAMMAAEEEAEASRRRVYTVRRGDTVLGIAARFDCRASDIVRWNDLGSEGMIIVGQELIVGR